MVNGVGDPVGLLDSGAKAVVLEEGELDQGMLVVNLPISNVPSGMIMDNNLFVNEHYLTDGFTDNEEVDGQDKHFARRSLWDQISNFHANCGLPWLVGGDFNTIASSDERLGGAIPCYNSMEDFNKVISNCNLIDIGFSGERFTWHRGHLWQRLDRVLFNENWLNNCGCTKVVHLSRTLSDHSPILIKFCFNNIGYPPNFRFQNMWLLHNSFKEVVKQNWFAPLFPDNSIVGMKRFWLKLKRLKLVLNWWNHNVFKNLFTNLINAENKVNAIESQCQTVPSEGRKKSLLFDGLISSLNKKLMSWDSNFLSFGGRLTLIKSVLCSIPVYSFQTLFPTLTVRTRIGRIINRFFWKGTSNNNKIHWTVWDNCCGSLDEGALGCKSLADLVYSFSVKLWFNFRANLSIWAKFMMSKYCRNSHPTMCTWNKGNSYVWKRLCKVKWDVEPHIWWGIGEGNIFFWQDHWLNGKSLDNIFNTSSNSTLKVNHFFNNMNGWDVEKLSSYIPECFFNQILDIEYNCNSQDALLCAFSGNGNFSLKEAWLYFRDKKEASSIYHLLWHKSIPTTVSVFIWRVLHNFISTDDILRKRGFTIVSKCHCCFHMETLQHVFISGPVAAKVWIYFEEFLHLNIYKGNLSINSLLCFWFVNHKGHIRNVIPSLILWFLWLERNNARYNGIPMNHQRVINNVKFKIGNLFSANLIFLKNFKNCDFALEGFGINGSDTVIGTRHPKIHAWMKPSVNCFKFNVDVATIDSVMGCGGLIRDSNGYYILGFAGPLHNSDVIVGINQAIFYGLSLCSSLDMINIVVEVCSIFTDQACIMDDNCMNIYPKVFYLRRDIKKLVNAMKCSFSVVNTNVNDCASTLAKWGSTLATLNHFPVDALPAPVKGLIELDKIGMPYV
ncbi:hypothetical protein M5K25_009965 [Dendrobium thyrsiflorum]|uniref:Uncharacterized protein n=1 Tax=Dendrobium thyrsiflorum TaxID=117978 RepID=A0ABD0VDW3_DENTH